MNARTLWMTAAAMFIAGSTGCGRGSSEKARVEGAGTADAAAESAAILEGMGGEVKIKRADGVEWVLAKKGMGLNDEDRVRTGGRSSAEIAVGGSDRIRMGENALVVIRSQEREALIEVTVGGVEVDVADADSSRMSIQFGDQKISFKRQDILFARPDPEIWGGKRGEPERFRLWATSQRLARFPSEGLDEKLAVRIKLTERGLKKAGERLDRGDRKGAAAILDRAWADVEAIRDEWKPPEKTRIAFERTESGTGRLRTLEGEAVVQAGGVKTVVTEKDAPMELEERATLANVKEEDVASIIVGEDEEIEAPARGADVPPPAPRGLSPGAGERFFNKDFALIVWEPLPAGVAAVVEVSRSPDFRSPVKSPPVFGKTSFAAPLDKEGKYYWRLKARDAEGREGAYGPVFSFEAEADREPPPLELDEPYFKRKGR